MGTWINSTRESLAVIGLIGATIDSPVWFKGVKKRIEGEFSGQFALAFAGFGISVA
jgi:hypothetical protein